MAAIVSGGTLGLVNSSLALLGAQGQLGTALHGRAGERVYLNAATGNLVVQGQDEILIGRGPDAALFRTYNSQGLLDDDNGDNWRLGFYRRVHGLTGTVNTAGSTVRRVDADGAEAVYIYDAGLAKYVTSEGGGAFDRLSYNAGTQTWTWTDGDTQLTESYAGATGRLTAVTDTSGNATTFTYNGSGLLTAVQTASGETTFLDYTGNNLTQVRTVKSGGATLIRTRYAYDASNRLTSVTTDLTPENTTDSKTYVTTYTYDGTSRRVATMTQSDGTSLAFTYVQIGASWRVASITDALARVTTVTYDTVNRTTTVTDPLGRTTVLAYDTANRLTSVSIPAAGGQQVAYAYDASGNVTSVTDAQGNAVVYAYDARGNRTFERDAAGNVVERVYGANNQLLAETVYRTPDPDGAGSGQPSGALTNRYVYDAATRLRFAVSAEGRVTEHRYNGFGQRVSSIQYTGAAYNVSGLAPTATLTEAQLTTWLPADRSRSMRADTAYDFRGQIATLTTYTAVDAAGNGVAAGQSVTQFVYDQAGNLLTTIDARSGTTSRVYDGLGRLLSTTDALNRLTLTDYQDANRKTVVTLANGLVSTSTYSAAGELISVLESASGATLGETKYFYDANGKLRRTEDPTGVKTHILYDAARRKIAEIDGDGSLTEFRYDSRGFPTRTVRYATAVSAAALASLSDAQGKPLEVALSAIRPAANAGDRSAWVAYDSAGRIVKTVDEGGFVTQNFYDGAGRLTDMVRYATAIAVAALGDAPLPSAINPTSASADRLSRTFYDADGNVAAVLDGEGFLAELKYDAAGRSVENVAYATATNPALRTSGTLDQLRPATSSADIRSYTLYNARGQVAGEVDGESYLTETVYDAAGNKTQVIRYATRVSYVAGASLASLRPAANAQDQVKAATYDAVNRVVSETAPDATVAQHTYDVAGNLVRTVKAANTADVRTLNAQYDRQGRLTAELTGVGSALLTGNQTQAEIDAIWNTYATRHTYDAAGRRTSTTDALGNKTRFYYDADGRVAYKINALGEVQRLVYDGHGELVQSVRHARRLPSLAGLNGGLVDAAVTSAVAAIADSPNDTVVSLAYDSRGNLRQTADALGSVQTETRNAFGDAIARSQQIAAGQTLEHTYAYDRRGLLTQTVWDPAGLNTSAVTQYDAFGRAIQTMDAKGNVRTASYDKLGRTVSVTDPLNATRSMTYDAFERVLTSTDALGRTTSYTYDTANRSTTVTTPEGVVATTVSNRHGETLSVTDGRGNTTTYQYDRNGNLTGVTVPGAGSATSSYDRADRLIETVDARGVRTTFAYDAAGRVLTRVVDPGGLALTTRTIYDAKGQAIVEIDANGVETRTSYDRNGQVTSVVVDPNGLRLETTFAYDGRGKTLTVVEGAGSAQQRVTVYAYDKLGRLLTERVDPAGLNITTTYAYDKNDNAVVQTDPNGNVTRYAYDSADRLVYAVDPLGGVTKREYDAEGRVVRFIAHANAISLTGLPAAPTIADIATRIVASAGDAIKGYVYDADGRERYCVDALGGVIEKIYDANGNVVRQVTYATPIAAGTPLTAAAVQAALVSNAADQVVRFVYDAANRAIYAIDAAGGVARMHYDANGNVTLTRAFANAVAIAGNPTQAALEAALVTSAADRVTRHVYDAANRQVYEIDAEGYVKETRYDNLGRITQTVQYPLRISVGSFPTAAEVAAALSASAAPSTLSGAYRNDTVYTGSATQPLVQPYTYLAAAKSDSATPASQAVAIAVSNATEFQSASITNVGWTRSGSTLVQGAGLSVVAGTVTANDLTPTLVRATLFQGATQVGQTTTEVGFQSTESWQVANGWDEFGNPVSWTTVSGTRWNAVSNWNRQANLSTGLAPGHYRIVFETRDDAQSAKAANTFYDLTDGTWTASNTLNDVVIGTINQPTVLAWAASTQPAGTASVSFEYRAAGSTGAYTNVAITTAGTNQQVNIAGLANGSYEYRIQYKDSYGRILKSANGNFTSTQGGSSSVNASFSYTTYASSAAAGSSIRYFTQASQWAPVDHVNATVKNQAGNVVSTAVTYPEAEAGYNGEVNLKVGAPLAEGTYTVELTIYNKNGTTSSIAPFVYEVGSQLAATRTTTVSWSAANKPAGTTVEFAYRRAGQSGAETIVVPVLENGSYRATFTYTNQGGIESGIADGVYEYTVRYKQGATVVSQARGQFAAAAGEQGAFTLNFTPTSYVLEERVNTFAYDRAGRLLQSTDALGFSESYGYDALGNRTSFTNKKGSVWTYAYDAAGRLVEETSPAVNVTTAAGAVETGVLLRTRLQYDALGNLIAQTEAYGRPEARTTQYQYDALGRQVRTTFPTVAIYNAAADNLGANSGATINRTEVAASLYSQVSYDTLGRAVVNRATDGAYSYKVYDADGRLRYDIDAEHFVTEHRYDRFGNETATIRYAQRLSSGGHTAGAAWGLAEVGAALSASAQDRRIDQVYDRSNRLVEVIEPQAYVYDSVANTGANGARRTLSEYNAFGEVVRTRMSHGVDAQGNVASWADSYFYFDARGARVAQVDAEGYLTEWRYDAAGNVTRLVEYARRAAVGWSVAEYVLPAAGDADSGYDRTTAYAYDLANRKVAETRVGVHFAALSGATSVVDATGDATTSFGYDALGNQVSVTDANGATLYTYFDALGRTIAVAAPARLSADPSRGGASLTPLSLFGVDAFGKTVRQTNLANGASAANATGFTAGAASGADQVSTTLYDTHGNAVQETDAEGAVKYFSYDAAGRLAKTWQPITERNLAGAVIATQNRVETYQYDAMGNQVATLDSSTRRNYVDPAYPTAGNLGITPGGVITQSATYVAAYDEYGNLLPPAYDEYGNPVGTVWLPNNTVNASWGVNLAALGGGEVKVVISYNHVSGGATSREFVLAGATATGATLTWADSHWTTGYGIASITGISLSKKNAAGAWVLLHSGANGSASTLIGWQHSSTGTLSVAYRANPGAAWSSAPTINFGAMGVADLRVTGATEFETRHTSADGAYAYQRGSVSGGAIGVSAIVTEQRDAYNAFGEITSRSVDGRPTQYFDYDNAGHLWRTNQEGGVDTVYLYDLQGKGTAEIRSMSADLRTYANAAAVDVATRAPGAAVRTETQYDMLERAVRSELPAFGAVGASVVHAPFPAPADDTWSISHDGFWSTDEYGNPFWNGSDRVVMSWTTLQGWGGRDIKVEVDVTTAQSGATTITRSLGANALAGATVALSQDITAVQRVRVLLKNTAGQYVLVRDSVANNARRLTLPTPVGQPGDFAVLRYKPAGTSTWSSITASNFGPVSMIDTNGWVNGTYDYEVQYKHADGTVYATGGGTLTLTTTAATVTPAGAQTVVPVVSQTLDRWGNTLSLIDPRFTTDPTPTFEEWERRYRYDEQSRVLTETSPLMLVQDANGGVRNIRSVVRNFYDRVGNAIGLQDANAIDSDVNNNGVYEYASTARYNAAGQVTRQIFADGGVLDYAYDAFGRKTGDWDARNYFTARAYDRSNRLTQITRPDGSTQQYRYDEVGDRVWEKDGRGNWQGYGYDAAGRIIRATRALGQTTSTFYDQLGRRTREINANGESQFWQYDQFGKVTQYVELAGHTTTFTYNRLGQTVSTSNARSNSTYTYDVNGALKRIDNSALSPNGSAWWAQSTAYQYDAAGNRTRETFIKQGTTYSDAVLAYDAWNRLVDVNDLRYHLTYTYDPNGNRRHTTASYFNNAGVFVNPPKEYWYTYDRMNRLLLTQGVLSGGAIVAGTQGTALAYDAAGNRVSATGASTSGATETYFYDSLGRLIQTNRNGYISNFRVYDGGHNVTQTNTYDASGVLTGFQVNAYDANGWLTQQTAYKHFAFTDGGGVQHAVSALSSQTTYTNRDAMGQVTRYTVAVHDPRVHDAGWGDEYGWHPNVSTTSPHQYTNTYNYTYAKFGGAYRESVVSGTSTHFQAGSNTTRYDGNGALVEISDQFQSSNFRSFITDQAGRILQKTQGGQTEFYFWAGDKPLGATGANGAGDFDFNYTPVTSRPAIPAGPADKAREKAGFFADGTNRSNAANDDAEKLIFDYPSMTPSNYVVSPGETLRSIAQAVYGDGGLWYLIADANGLAPNQTLTVGMDLKIPNRITNLHNSYETFKPYEPEKIIGDTTPTLPNPPPPKKKGCGGFGLILIAIVAIVVAAIVAPMIATALAPALGAQAAGIVGAAVGGAAGSVASQGVAIALGMQDKFNWGAVAVAALSAGITQGVIGSGSLPGGFTEFGKAIGPIGRAVVGNAINQGVGILLGQQNKFSWASIAGAAVGAAVTEAIAPFGTQTSFEQRFAGNFFGSLAGGLTKAALSGGKIDFRSILADAFGNAVGSAIVELIMTPAQQEEELRRRARPQPVADDGADEAMRLLEQQRAEREAILQMMDTEYELGLEQQRAAQRAAAMQMIDMENEVMRELQAQAAMREWEADTLRREAERAAIQWGYGDQPLGVPLSQMSRLTRADVINFIEARFNSGDLEGAINGAYAWSVQVRDGDHVGFNWLMERLGESNDRFYVMAARDRAIQVALSGIDGNIRAMNDAGENFGSRIYELQRRIANDPDNAYAYIYQALAFAQARAYTGIGGLEQSAFRDFARNAGYSSELEDAIRNMSDRAVEEYHALGRMSTSERFSRMQQMAWDNGAIDPGGAVMMGMAMGAMFRPRPLTELRGMSPPPMSLQPGQSTPVPQGYYREDVTVNMRYAPPWSDRTAEGHQRNQEWFWRQMYRQFPELFDDDNRAAIMTGKAPTVTPHWARHFPQHQSFMGDTLVHHHINQGPIATPIPQTVHRGLSGMLHRR